MARYGNLVTISKMADADFSTKQYTAVKASTVADSFTAGTAGDPILGVLQDNPAASGRVGAIAVDGLTKAKSGGTITNGDYVEVGAAGVFITHGSGTIVGQASEDAIINQIFQFRIIPNGVDVS